MEHPDWGNPGLKCRSSPPAFRPPASQTGNCKTAALARRLNGNRFTAGACCVLLPRLKRTASQQQNPHVCVCVRPAPGWSAAFDSIFFIIFLYFCAVSIFQCSLFCVLNISDSLFLVLRDSASPNSRKKPHAAARDNVSDRMSSDRQLNTEI